MEDDLLILLIGLAALAIPILTIWSFVLVLSTRRTIAVLQQQIATLEAKHVPPPVQSQAVPEEQEAPADDLSDEQAELEQAVAMALGSVPAVPLAPSEPQPPSPPPEAPGLEAKLGSRWAVWIGGLALALGGIFLVRYSIERNLLAPEIRVLLGALFALGLVGAGEWLRRESSAAVAGIPAAHVPGILTAAGTCTAFATAYAAYGLYGLIGPATAFVLLGIIAVSAILAAAVHGPALAGLGLVGALGSPLLVASNEPQPWALVPYLAFVLLAAYGVARLRVWRWLAVAGAAGAVLWSFPIFVLGGSDTLPAMAHVSIQTVLAGLFLVAGPHRHPSEEARTDWLAGGILFAFAVTSLLVASSIHSGDGRSVFAGLMALTLLTLGIRFPPAAPASAWACLVTVGTLFLWPIRREIGGGPENFMFQSGDVFALRPDALDHYRAFAAVMPALIAGLSLRKLARSSLPLAPAGWYAAAATSAPLLALIASYWRIAGFERDLSFGLIAAALALVFTGATSWLQRQSDQPPDSLHLAIGATASAALAALAFGLTFVLDKGMLTVAFALTALATAWIADRTGIPALRYAVGAIGLVILGRLAWSPAIVSGDPGGIIVNWLLWGYGIPALSFFYASRLLAKVRRDWITRLVESLSFVFATFLIFFEIRHGLNGTDDGLEIGHLEAGLYATESLAFSILLTWMDLRRPDPVYRYGSLIFRVISLLVCGAGLLLLANPFLNGGAITGGTVFNSLIPAYLIPSILAFVLAALEWGRRPHLSVVVSAVLGLLLQLAYVFLEIRRIFQGPDILYVLDTGQGEQWSYSVALLVTGIVLLGLGFVRNLRFARLASAVYLVLAVLKVFIVDLAHLDGVMRALSFIGLGLVLIGIGLVYQRLLIQRPADAASP